MLRGPRLRQAERLGEVADETRLLAEQIEDPPPRGLGEGAERGRHTNEHTCLVI
jgi:hypothetical protein